MNALFLLFVLAAEPATLLAPERLGCIRNAHFPDRYECSEGPIARLGCGGLHRVDTLDGLLPAVAAIECEYLLPDPNDPGDLRAYVPGIRVLSNGPFGPPRVTICLLIDNGSGRELITSRDEFFLRFAPVESAAEARAFIRLLTALSTNDAEGAPLPVVETDAGYVMRNVVVPSVGCEVKPSRAATFTVTRDGQINASDWGPELPER